MKLAIEKARDGIKRGQTPFGAAIARKNKSGGYDVISVEHNEVWDKTDITEHAEINAIRKACARLGKVKLTNCIIASTTEPCPMCFSAIHWAGVKEIYYGTNISDAQKAKFSELTISNQQMKKLGKSPVKIHPDYMRKEAEKLFNDWVKNPKKKTY
ncbi:MAG: nucleoside deaminase [Candidatus Altiarchaeota archaeon]|nr:nucleoside deaminase [Candidatus Altiarchaeota archaeon]